MVALFRYDLDPAGVKAESALSKFQSPAMTQQKNWSKLRILWRKSLPEAFRRNASMHRPDSVEAAVQRQHETSRGNPRPCASSWGSDP